MKRSHTQWILLVRLVCGLAVLLLVVSACGTAPAENAPPSQVPPFLTDTVDNVSTSPAPVLPTSQSLPDDVIRVDYSAAGTAAPELYGSNGWWSDQDAEIWKARHAQLGVRMMRIPAAQSIFEPQNDDTDPNHINPEGFLFRKPIPWFGRTLTLANWLSALHEQDVTLMLHIPYIAGWLSNHPRSEFNSPYPPNNLAEYEEYVTALLSFVVNDLGYDPEKVILEPVNEPDLACGQDANVTCFWQDWQEQDLLAVLQSARRASQAVDPAIRMVGVSECCGTTLTERLMADANNRNLLDGLTYHKYVRDSSLEDMLARGERLKAYGKPVFLNEYGSTRFWSNGQPGALWHAALLPKLFAAGIIPLQYSISHFPGAHAGYDQLGLFEDWRNDFATKPAYWVYTYFYRLFGGGTILADLESGGSHLFAVKNTVDGAPLFAVWVVSGTEPPGSISLAFQNLPAGESMVYVLDAFSSGTVIQSQQLNAPDTLFSFQPQPERAYIILVTASRSPILDELIPPS